jgi:hypothetical protein
MDLYKLGSLFLDISIAILVIGALIRLILALTYFKRNGSRILSDTQRKALRKITIPIAVSGLLFAIASLVMLTIM